MELLQGHKTYGRVTQVAGTVITRLVEPRKGAYTVLTYTEYINAGTAHALTVLRPLGKTTLTAAAAAAQAVVNIAANPGNYPATQRTADNLLAASDFVVLELPDNTYVLDTVSSISSLAVTLATVLPTLGAAKGATLWHFGIITDVNPFDALAHPQFTLPASGTTIFGDTPGEALTGWIAGYQPGDPLILHSGNATAAGTLERVSVAYTKLGGQRGQA